MIQMTHFAAQNGTKNHLWECLFYQKNEQAHDACSTEAFGPLTDLLTRVGLGSTIILMVYAIKTPTTPSR
ncbi:MAG: hypothetical protein ACPGWR_23105 [Ardenticatenaceae bacterium]